MTIAKNERRKPGRPKETKALAQTGPDFVTKTPQDIRDAEAICHVLQIDAEQHLVSIDKEYGDGVPYNEDRIVIEVRSYLEIIQSNYIRAGRCLLVLKEHKLHDGDSEGFHNALARIGVTPRRAQEMILVAKKFAERPALASLGNSKLLELAKLQDDVLDELEDGGTVDEVSKDKIEKMTAREAKTAVRKLQQDLVDEKELRERLLKNKQQVIDALDEELDTRKKRVEKWDGVMIELGTNITRFSGEAIMQINHLRAQIDQILTEAERLNVADEEVAVAAEAMCHAINSVQGYLDGLAASFTNKIGGYMPVHDIPYQPLPDTNQDIEHDGE